MTRAVSVRLGVLAEANARRRRRRSAFLVAVAVAAGIGIGVAIAGGGAGGGAAAQRVGAAQRGAASCPRMPILRRFMAAEAAALVRHVDRATLRDLGNAFLRAQVANGGPCR